jgi:dTDP-4-dehydrorhamnose reductase
MKILVLGCKGQLGRCLNDQLKSTDHEVIYTSREQIDIADFEVTKSKILKVSPNLIINATAYTAVDKAEEDQKTANLINHLAVKNIADICNQLECWLIHVSTDYVFDGNSKVPYKEDDETNPQGAYGETKLKGELAIQASDCRYIIIRTAWVFSEYGNNFLKTMLRLGAERDQLSIVDDQVGCPTYAQNIAKAIVVIMRRLKSEENIIGTYHFVGEVGCSWADFAEDIFKEAIKQGIIKNKPKITIISTSEFPTLAKRPMQSKLDFSKFKSTFGINQSNYEDSICLALEGYEKLKHTKEE